MPVSLNDRPAAATAPQEAEQVPTGPTRHPPGSTGKARVMRARAARKLPLFDPKDAPLTHHTRDAEEDDS